MSKFGNEEPAFIIGLCTGVFLSVVTFGIIKAVSTITPDTKQPTVKCTDGNITIYEKRPFTTCEER